MTDPKRLELHEKLAEILGSRNVYFQPPESKRMSYPAIVYGLSTVRTNRADNNIYLLRKRYSVTVIDKDPDSNWEEQILNSFEYCSFDRSYAADNLNHWQFVLYY